MMGQDRALAQMQASTLEKLAHALVGSWKLSGGASGLIRYERAEGGHFLIQHIDIVVLQREIRGVEIIGHLRRVSEKPSAEIWSRFYSFGDGLTLDYVYEIDGKNFMIWFCNKKSNNRFVGQISEDGRSYGGAWTWPGGGYEVEATKVSWLSI